MELLLISDKKMKIMLTKEDMESFGLSSEKLDYDIEATREALDKILESAKAKTGFAGGARTYIQAFALKSGGCEIFLTVCDGASAGLIEQKKEYLLSCFESEDLCKNAARYISRNAVAENVRIYKDEYTDRFYLLAKSTTIEDGEKYIKALCYEFGALSTVSAARMEFSMERYGYVEY